jgi:hypothetical protein
MGAEGYTSSHLYAQTRAAARRSIQLRRRRSTSEESLSDEIVENSHNGTDQLKKSYILVVSKVTVVIGGLVQCMLRHVIDFINMLQADVYGAAFLERATNPHNS